MKVVKKDSFGKMRHPVNHVSVTDIPTVVMQQLGWAVLVTTIHDHHPAHQTAMRNLVIGTSVQFAQIRRFSRVIPPKVTSVTVSLRLPHAASVSTMNNQSVQEAVNYRQGSPRCL